MPRAAQHSGLSHRQSSRATGEFGHPWREWPFNIEKVRREIRGVLNHYTDNVTH